MVLALRALSDADRLEAVATAKTAGETQPTVHVFGSGHVGRALAACLSLLPVRTVLVDERADELAKSFADVEQRVTAVPEAEVRTARPGSAFVILTHDHGLDFLIAAEALARGDAAYVGMIGSATKRAKFKSHCEREVPGLDTQALVCPIGANPTGDKRPSIIAAFVAAEIMTALDGFDG